jgi:hypothetical protein
MSHHVDMSSFFGGQKKSTWEDNSLVPYTVPLQFVSPWIRFDLFEQTVYGYTGGNRWPRLYWREQMA